MTGRLCPSANALAPAANCMSKADGERQDVEVSTEFAKVSYDSDHFHILCFAFQKELSLDCTISNLISKCPVTYNEFIFM